MQELKPDNGATQTTFRAEGGGDIPSLIFPPARLTKGLNIMATKDQKPKVIEVDELVIRAGGRVRFVSDVERGCDLGLRGRHRQPDVRTGESILIIRIEENRVEKTLGQVPEP